MSEAFIIMQIGNPELDKVCEQAIIPAIEACNMDAKRVDKHNEGGLLKSEIITFIQNAKIIIADVTNERPNCYLEIGYAMGLDKFKNVIITVREDHFPESPNHVKGEPKIHFDLAGYDILLWHPDKIEDFRIELEKRIRRRMVIIKQPSKPEELIWNSSWLDSQREIAYKGLSAAGFSGGMEIRFALEPPKINKSQIELDQAAKNSVIHTFGWPVAIYSKQEESRPKPRSNGIFAEINAGYLGKSYDYWSIKKTGDFYTLLSFFEDQEKPGHIFYTTRIVRLTESLLYCARLYERLGIDKYHKVYFATKYTGLKDRKLLSADRYGYMNQYRDCTENEFETKISFSLQDIESNLTNIVKDLIAPLLMLFDFYELSDDEYEKIVDKFVKGEVI